MWRLKSFCDNSSPGQAAVRAMAKRVQGSEASVKTYTELKVEDFAAARRDLGNPSCNLYVQYDNYDIIKI